MKSDFPKPGRFGKTSMCGICGIISKTEQRDLLPVLNMQRAMEHRGPDDEGLYQNKNIRMAMRRLSIIDPNGGKQPLYNEDKTLALISNAEIYNFIELRQNLIIMGHDFKTCSDCETILHLYEEYGLDLFKHLRGMFAFALWDDREKKLILGRDRMGEKPLYYYERPDRLVFCSELKALLKSGIIPFELDPMAIDRYLHYQYVPEPDSVVKNVRKLEAGTFICIETKQWHLRKERYWLPEEVPSINSSPSKTIRSQLDRVSEIIIRSDVPVGVSLSGGIDSGIVATLAAKKYPDTLHAFCVGYPGRPSCDERTDAKMLADRLGIPFHEIEISEEELERSFPDIVAASDEPIADISAIGQFYIARLARRYNIPVLLSGLGGDELFWGYEWFRGTVQPSITKNFLRRRAPFLFSNVGPLLENFAGEFARNSWTKKKKGRINRLTSILFQLIYMISEPKDQLVMYDISPHNFSDASTMMPRLYAEKFKSLIPPRNSLKPFTIPGDWGNVPITLCLLEFAIWLRSNCLTLGDRLSMASSIEMRMPLLDHKIVESTIGLRKVNSDHHLPAKAWLKEACSGILPNEIFQRPKRGFTPPYRSWTLRLLRRYSALVERGRLTEMGVLDYSALSRVMEIWKKGEYFHLFYKILVLEMWIRRVFLEESFPRQSGLKPNKDLNGDKVG